MKDKLNILFRIITVCICVIVLFSFPSCTKKTNWKPTLKNTDKNPYGTFIVYDLLEDIFDKDNINVSKNPVGETLYPYLEEYIDYYYLDEGQEQDKLSMSFYDSIVDVDVATTYLSITKSFDLYHKDELIYLLDFVAIGNNVFIAAESFDNMLLDTLKLDYIYHIQDTSFVLTDYDTSRIYNFKSIILNNHNLFDTDSCKFPLRTLATNQKLKQSSFIKVQYGKGYIYLHTLPVAFTNLSLLNKEKYDFAFQCLSYIPKDSHIIWDEYSKKAFKRHYGEDPKTGDGIFKVMLNSPPLRASLFLILIGLLLYMLFASKRKQRIIPEIKLPVNSSIEFMSTISNLFYKKKDYKAITTKRHAYFLEFIRSNYHIPTENINNEFIDFLHAKTEMNKEDISRIFTLYNDITQENTRINEAKFMQYNLLLEKFYDCAKTNQNNIPLCQKI